MKYPRLRKIEEYVLQCGFVDLDELCEVFDCSKSTIRRDVAELVGTGALEKVYGGVRAARPPTSALRSFSERSVKQAREKKVIGALAARFVNDNDVVYIDSGTTTLALLPHLTGHTGLTLVTVSVHAVNFCFEHPNLNVISLGGQLNRATAAFTPDAHDIEALQKFNINKAFMAATGITIEKGATNQIGELPIKKKVMERSDKRYLMVDSTKFDHAALLTYADLADFHYVITDTAPPKRYQEHLREQSVQLVAGKARGNAP